MLFAFQNFISIILYVLDTIVLHLNYLVGDSPVATDYVLVISRLWYGNVTDPLRRTSQFRKRNSEYYLTLYQGFPQVFFSRPKTLLCMQCVIFVRRPHLQSNREGGMQPQAQQRQRPRRSSTPSWTSQVSPLFPPGDSRARHAS